MKQLHQVNLAAGFRQHVEIFVMNMNVTIDMCCCNVFWQNIVIHKIIGSLGAIFQHGTHGGICINIRILTLDIRICGTGEGKLPVYIHQIRLCLANLGVLCPIKDICLRSLGKSIDNQFLFHKILHLFYVRYLSCRNGFHHFIYQFFKLDRRDCLNLGSFICLMNRAADFVHIERYRSSVSLFYGLRTCDGIFLHVTPSKTISGILFLIPVQNTVSPNCVMCKDILYELSVVSQKLPGNPGNLAIIFLQKNLYIPRRKSHWHW